MSIRRFFATITNQVHGVSLADDKSGVACRCCPTYPKQHMIGHMVNIKYAGL
jgi:hypothetical protein